MTTTVKEAPTQQRTRDRDPLIHWCCVTITAPPHICLCGELVSGKRVGSTTDRGMCVVCLDLAAEHCAGCPPCARWLARFGR